MRANSRIMVDSLAPISCTWPLYPRQQGLGKNGYQRQTGRRARISSVQSYSMALSTCEIVARALFLAFDERLLEGRTRVVPLEGAGAVTLDTVSRRFVMWP